GPELTGNLLICRARDDHGDHLVLARSQQFGALFQFRYFFFLFAPRTILLQRDANGIEQILVAEWLSQEFNRPSLHSANAHRNVPVAGDKDYRDANVSFRKLLLKIKAA